MRYDVYEIKNQSEYCGEFDDLTLKTFLENLPLSKKDIHAFYRAVMSNKSDTNTIRVQNDWSVEIEKITPFEYTDQFMTVLYDMYHYDIWSDEMIRNIIDEAEAIGWDDSKEAFRLLDTLLPCEISRSLIKRLPFLN